MSFVLEKQPKAYLDVDRPVPETQSAGLPSCSVDCVWVGGMCRPFG